MFQNHGFDMDTQSNDFDAHAFSEWYVIYTKPRQENRALQNLTQQGYECYLPQRLLRKVKNRGFSLLTEPLFPRYLFIKLGTNLLSKSWAPIRSTLGVTSLLSFGNEPANVSDGLIQLLRAAEKAQYEVPEPLFKQGEKVEIKEGPFLGIQGVFQTIDGDMRAIVLIELLNKLSRLKISVESLVTCE